MAGFGPEHKGTPGRRGLECFHAVTGRRGPPLPALSFRLSGSPEASPLPAREPEAEALWWPATPRARSPRPCLGGLAGRTGGGRAKGRVGLWGQQDGSFWRQASVGPCGGVSGGQWAAGTLVGGAARSLPGPPDVLSRRGLAGAPAPGALRLGGWVAVPPSRRPRGVTGRRAAGAALVNPCSCCVPVQAEGATSCGRKIIAEGGALPSQNLQASQN